MTHTFTPIAAVLTHRSPMILLGYQSRFCADGSPVKVVEKSRRIGMSWAVAADSSLLAASNSGMDVWYVGYNRSMAQEFIRDCANWAKYYGLVADEIEEVEEVFTDGKDKESICAYVIRFASGWRITALSSSPSNLRGKQGRVIIDEAAFHPCLGELLKAAMALLMWGGQVYIISTHNGVDNPFNELVNDIKAGRYPYSLHTITFKNALKDGLYERICLRQTKDYNLSLEKKWEKEIRDSYGDDASEELDCIPKNSGGKWLSRAMIESLMKTSTPVIRLVKDEAFSLKNEYIRRKDIKSWCDDVLLPVLETFDKTKAHFFGEDFARSGDLTVLSICSQEQNLKKKVRLMIELGNVPFKQQEQIVLYVLKRLPNFSGGAFDARGNGQYLAECAKDVYGSLIDCVMLSEKFYREHTAQFKADLEDGILSDLPKDADILNDLRSFEVVKGVPRIPDRRNTSVDGKSKRHGDSAISLLLMHYASRQLDTTPVKARVSRKKRRSKAITQGY